MFRNVLALAMVTGTTFVVILLSLSAMNSESCVMYSWRQEAVHAAEIKKLRGPPRAAEVVKYHKIKPIDSRVIKNCTSAMTNLEVQALLGTCIHSKTTGTGPDRIQDAGSLGLAACANVPIVGVYWGRVPDYVYAGLRQLRLWNPITPMVFITENQTPHGADHGAMLKHLVANNVTYIPIDILRFDSIVDDFERAFAAWPAPTSGQMNNFNTFLRWPILAAYMKMYEVAELVHFESDIMVFGATAELVSAARKCHVHFAISKLTADQSAPAVVYIADRTILEDYLCTMTDAARYGPECFIRVMGMDNDMLSTATFMRTWRASVPEKEKHRMASFWQGGGRVDDQLEDEWRCLRSNWDYIVDAARYGQYFFGTRQGSFFDGYNGVDLRKPRLLLTCQTELITTTQV